MIEAKLDYKTKLGDLLVLSRKKPSIEVTCSMSTVWWNVPDITHRTYANSKTKLPADPLGGTLVKFSLSNFLDAAIADPMRYGTNGMLTLMAAFHGNLRLKDGDTPTTVRTWELLDLATTQHQSNPDKSLDLTALAEQAAKIDKSLMRGHKLV